ncbi:hypothetical protein [Micromonospora craniellae]|uniref:Tetratricopeptide repeat protein n=1 Tax=Micromonospora craniellae TaxID=2294034 RepID=A0A372G088_9ACTN|nr:hypothetical protein [Micromonospora craniellae]QOC94568.1 hypothetical protein ID554_13990 [Micromonospora craniellae]RFS46358.1 hypothetical protein D0Q02_11275 [Micromonospora craniellae]
MADEDLWRMLRQTGEMPYGIGQIAALEQLLRRADAGDDRHLAFAVRIQGITTYIYGGEPAKSFVVFAWCLAEFDKDPQPYHQRYAQHLLWHFKHMVNGMLTFPEVPLDRTHAVLDDMERRYREGGHSLQAVYKYRYRVADHLGDREQAGEWYRRWLTTPRDQLSDCAGCDPTTQVNHLSRTGRHDEAVALAEPVLSGRLSCTEQPQGILTALLPAYLHSGRRDEARNAHREAYRRHRGSIADLWDVSEHIEFCTLTGNEARALEIVERHLDWLDRAPSPGAAMHFATSAAAALRQVDDQTLTVHRRAFGERPAAEVTLGTLVAELTETATAIAARFDARNGNSHQSEGIARRLAVTPVGDHLPLSASLRRRLVPATRPAPADGSESEAVPAREVTVPGPRRPAEFVVPAEASTEELLELAEQRWAAHDRAGMRTALAAFDERYGAVELSPRQRARRLELRATELIDANDVAGAVTANRVAMAAYEELPDPARVQVIASRLGVLLDEVDEPNEEGFALVRAAAEFLDVHGDDRQRSAAYDRLAVALTTRERWTEALAASDRAAAATTDRFLTARIALHRVHILEHLDDHEDFLSDVERARQLAREAGADDLIVATALVYAGAVEDPAEAVGACDEAFSHATEPSLLAVRVARARALVTARRAEEAVEDYAEAVALCVERGEAGDAYLRWELANAYRMAGRLGEAAEVAEEAVTGLDRLGHQADADAARHLLAGIYQGLGEIDPALALLDRLAENLDGPDNLPHRAQVLEDAGDILYQADRDAAAAQKFAAAASAYQLAGRHLDELRARRREASAHHYAGETASALRAVEVTDRLAGELTATAADEPPVIYEVSLAAENAARVLAGDDREDEALDRLAGVAHRLRSVEAFGEAAQVEILTGELLLRRGRPAEAEPVLREVLGGLPARSRPSAQTAWLLARALDELGRSAEATDLRQQHGLDHDH